MSDDAAVEAGIDVRADGSGSPSADAIAFGTDGWRARLSTFTTPRVRMVAQGVATTLRDRGATAPVAVGYDARETSRNFAEEVSRVLAANGVDVWIPQRDCPTPVTAWTVKEHDLAGAVIITASHNPPEYNGIKFVPAGGAPGLPALTDEIEANLAPARSTVEAEAHGGVDERDFVGPYLDHVRSFVAHEGAPLDDLTVAYDAMHGSGRDVTDRLLESVGVTVERLRCERDPDFGGTAPEPAADRVETLVERVTEGPADLGIVNDGDADRIGVVTPDRGYLDPNLFFAAIYDYLLEDRSGDVVRSVSTSSVVDRVAEAHGTEVHEVAVGFKWVAEAMAEHDALIGGEESGGFGVSEHLHNKDGVLMALVAAAATAETPLDERVDDLLAIHGEIHQGKLSVDCPDDRKEPVLDELETALPEAVAGVEVADVNTVDGFKIVLEDDTWLLIRPSGTEPKMRVYAEAGSGGRVDELLAAGEDLVEPLV